MQAYVLVVDTPHFAVTDEEGGVRIAGLESRDYEAHVYISANALQFR